MRVRAWLGLVLVLGGCGPGAREAPDAALDAGRDAAPPDVTVVDVEVIVDDAAAPVDAAPLVDIPIQDVQDLSRITHVSAGARVRLDGVVVTARDADANLFVVQEPTGAPGYAGVMVNAEPLPAGATLPAVGDLVDLQGTVREVSRAGYTGSRTSVESLTSLAVVGSAPVPAAALVTPTEINLTGARAEELEGVLVKLGAVSVGVVEPGFGTFTVDGGLTISNRLFPAAAPLAFPFARDSYGSIGGILDFDFGAPRLLPRSDSDLTGYVRAPACLDALAPTNTTVGEGQSVTLTAALDRPAPPGGVALALDSSSPANAAPAQASVTVAAGALSAPVVVNGVLTSASAVNIGAAITGCGSAAGMRKTTTVTVLNGPTPRLAALSPANLYVMGNGGQGSEGVLTLRLDRPAPAPPAAATTVTLTSGDARLAVPAVLTVPPGATVAAFKVRGAGAPSATAVTVGASFNASSVSAAVTVVSLASLPVAEQVQLNELLAAPAATLPDGDANCDGVANSVDDEFVELVSVAPQPLDLSNVQLNDAAATPNGHRFAAGTILGPGESIVIFGGGAALPMATLHPWCAGTFAGARLERANLRGTLGLNNGGDTLTLRSAAGVTLTQVSYGAVAAGPSVTRDPDLTGALVVHSSAVGRAGDRPYSPGTRLTGAPFWLASP